MCQSRTNVSRPRNKQISKTLKFMAAPTAPKIYHIVHVDRLPSIVNDNYLWSDATVEQSNLPGTTIGMSKIKLRRLNELNLSSYPDLRVGACVPFYFCPRSVMLYLIHKRNHELTYQDGQDLIVHLEADLFDTVQWAESQDKRWAFTLSNAGARYVEDRNNLENLEEIDWSAVNARDWRTCKEEKQAEFLIEHSFPWALIELIGVYSHDISAQVNDILSSTTHKPSAVIRRDWYY